jgi:hypothetical protein
MASHDPDLEKLTSLLRQCLGRIDEEAFRIQETGDGMDFDSADRLEDEAQTLQELVDSLLVVDMGDSQANLNKIVSHAAEVCLQNVTVPIVLRQLLAPSTPPVASPASMVSVAVERAIILAFTGLEAGDEVILSTRSESGSVMFEVESRGNHQDSTTRERSETLREFVNDFGGACQVRCGSGNLYLVIELPEVVATDRTESL